MKPVFALIICFIAGNDAAFPGNNMRFKLIGTGFSSALRTSVLSNKYVISYFNLNVFCAHKSEDTFLFFVQKEYLCYGIWQ